jgi:hypothetical protein
MLLSLLTTKRSMTTVSVILRWLNGTRATINQGCNGLVLYSQVFFIGFSIHRKSFGSAKTWFFMVFSSERNFSTFGFIHSKMRNSVGPEKVKLVYIKTNYAAVADVVRPCESDDDSDSDCPFPVNSD